MNYLDCKHPKTFLHFSTQIRDNRFMGGSSFSYVWDYNLSTDQFEKILNNNLRLGHLDSDWAAVRLLDYAPYEDIVKMIGFRRLVDTWPRWKNKVRSQTRKRGLDFLVSWLPKHHPELL